MTERSEHTAIEQSETRLTPKATVVVPEATHDNDAKAMPCRYTRQKGVATLIAYDQQVARFEYYPDDLIVDIARTQLPWQPHTADLMREFKASRLVLETDTDSNAECKAIIYEIAAPLLHSLP